MKKYRVSFYYQESGHTIVKAKNENAARKKVYKQLEEDGTENLDYRTTDREYDANFVEPVDSSLFGG